MQNLRLEPKDMVKVTVLHTPHQKEETLTRKIPCKHVSALLHEVFTPPQDHNPDQKFTPPKTIIIERGNFIAPIHGSLPQKDDQAASLCYFFT
jgi:hypothetical protein